MRRAPSGLAALAALACCFLHAGATGADETTADRLAEELVLRVLLNGREVSAGSIVHRLAPDGRLAVEGGELEAWRLPSLPEATVAVGDARLQPLGTINGLEARIDEASLTLELTVDPRQLSAYEVASDAQSATPPASTASGAFLDYDLLYTVGGETPQAMGGLAELGTFSKLGVGVSSFLFNDLTRAPQAVRLETSFTKDMPERRATLKLGDGTVVGGAMAPPFRFGGVQFGTNFATDPAFVTFPLPVIGGLAEQSATVDVIVDNITQFSRQVPPGPFRLDTPPVVSGAGEVQLRVTDLLGREQIVLQPFYVSSRLLRSGLHDFSYAGGAVRERYGESSFDYGELFASGTHRYGLTDWLTLEGHGDLARDYQGLAGGGTMLAGRFGVVSGGLGLAHDTGEGLGWLGQLGYEYRARSFDVGLSTRYRSPAATGLGELARPGRTDRVNLGLDLGAAGRLGLLLVNDETGQEDSRAALGTYSLRLGPGALVVNLGQTITAGSSLSALVSYSMPLGTTQSVSSSARLQDGRGGLEARWRKGRGAADTGWDYGAAVAAGSDPTQLAGFVGYQSPIGAARVDVDHFQGTNNLRLDLTGSVLAMAGKVALTRRLGQGFGVVDVGLPDVRVYVENREAGKTGKDGRFVLPDLNPYQANRLSIEVDDLPLDAVVEEPERIAVPYARSGTHLAFAVRLDRRATAVLLGADGQPLPRGVVLGSPDAAVSARVGLDGFAEIRGLAEHEVVLAGEFQGVPLRCALAPPPAGDLLSDLGPIRCQ